MTKKPFIFIIALFLSVAGFVAAQSYSCNSLIDEYGDKIAEYDQDSNNQITADESIQALRDYLSLDLAEGYFLAIVRFDRNNCVLPEQENDPVSGALSVNKTEVAVGENIELTVTGQDNDGVTRVWAYYQGSWHSDYAEGTSWTNTWTFAEDNPGTYVYRGYVYGKESQGLREAAYTDPKTVTVVVEEGQTCTDSDGGKNYYTKGVAKGIYVGSDDHVIYNEYGNFSASPYNYSIYHDHCANDSQLNEGYCREDGKLGAIGYDCPYGCSNGVCKPAPEKAITVTSPNGGEYWEPSKTYVISWDSEGVDKINIYLEDWKAGASGGPQTWLIATNVSASLGQYSWKVENLPTSQGGPIHLGNYYKIRIVDASDNSSYASQVADSSDNYFGIVATEFEDAVSGTLSVNKTEVELGEQIQLTVTGQDDNGVTRLWAYYQGSWHSDYADGNYGNFWTNTWTFSENTPGNYVYRGYVYGRKANGDLEYTYTDPASVTVTVAEKQDCKYLYWFDDEHSTCGYQQFCGTYMYYGLQTFITEGECEEALSQGDEPDLIITSAQVKPSSPTTDDEISFSVTIKNIGSVKVPYVSGGIITRVSSDNSLPDPGWRICDAMVKQLAPNESTTIDCPIVRTLSAGSHVFTFLVDEDNRLAEANESNNEKRMDFTVESAVSKHKLDVKLLPTSDARGAVTFVDENSNTLCCAFDSAHCPSSNPYLACSDSFSEGRSVTLTAHPLSGFEASWSGCSSSDGNVCVTKMDNNKIVSASFNPIAEKEDTVSGTLSVNKTNFKVGEEIHLTVTGQDDQGMLYVYAHYHGKWNLATCPDSTNCSDEFIFYETQPGTYTYRGSLKGKTLAGSTEDHYTNPETVVVTVTADTTSQQEDQVSGTLFANKTSVVPGELIELTVTGQDDNGLEKLWAYYQGSWHSVYASGVTDAYTWKISEDEPGTYVYRGYVYGKTADGSREYAATRPSSVTVTVNNEGNESENNNENNDSTSECSDTDGGANYYQYGAASHTNSGIEGRIDCCKLYYSTNTGDSVNHIGAGGGACVSEGTYLYEAVCDKEGIPDFRVYQCPNGCKNGVCVSNSSQTDLSSMIASIQQLIEQLKEALGE